jgi:hypothetical protein
MRSNLFPVFCSLFFVPCSLFPVPCSLKRENSVPHKYENCYIFDISGSDWLVVLTFSFSVTSQDSLMFLSESRIERDRKKPGLESILVLARFFVFKPGFSNSAIAALEPKAIAWNQRNRVSDFSLLVLGKIY